MCSQAEDYAGLKDRLQQSFSRHSVQLEMWRSRTKLGPLSAEDCAELAKLLSSLQSKRELSSFLRCPLLPMEANVHARENRHSER